MTGEWLAYCAACPVPEIANVFNRARIPFHQVTGMLGRRPGVLERSRRVDRRRPGRLRDGAQPPRRDGPLLRRHARHLFRPDAAVRLLRRPRRNGRSGRTGRAARGGHGRRRSKSASRTFHEDFDVQPDCSPRGTRARGADFRRPGPAGRSSTTSARWPTTTWARATRRTRTRSARSSSATSLLTARGIPVAGEIRNQERPGHEDHGQLRRGRIVHRVLRDGFQRRRGADGPRRPGPHRHRRRQDQGAPAEGLSRQSRPRTVGRDVREARAGDAAVGRADGGRPAETPGGRRRVGARARSWRSATPTAATASPSARGGSSNEWNVPRPGAPLRRRRGPHRREDREAGEPAGDGRRADLLEGALPSP